MFRRNDLPLKRRGASTDLRGTFLGSLLLLLFLGCSPFLLHYYDPTTYKNLTDLKPKVAVLYETFEEEAIDLDLLRQVRLEMAQAYEYERGKGEKNRETVGQLRLILQMFSRHVEERKRSGSGAEDGRRSTFKIGGRTSRRPLTSQLRPNV